MLKWFKSKKNLMSSILKLTSDNEALRHQIDSGSGVDRTNEDNIFLRTVIRNLEDTVKRKVWSVNKLESEIATLEVIIDGQADILDINGDSDTQLKEMERRLKNLQGKYDSKVARYKKIITKLESKNEAK